MGSVAQPVCLVLVRFTAVMLHDKQKSPRRNFSVFSHAVFRRTSPPVFMNKPVPGIRPRKVLFHSAVRKALFNERLAVHFRVGDTKIIEPDFTKLAAVYNHDAPPEVNWLIKIMIARRLALLIAPFSGIRSRAFFSSSSVIESLPFYKNTGEKPRLCHGDGIPI